MLGFKVETPGKRSQGMRRKELDGKYPYEIEAELQPGDYAKCCDQFKPQLWVVRAPNGDLGTLSSSVHQIVEHDAGTITVSPSIQFLTGQRYHGFLKAGVWS
jgi:hypothetical protein